MNYQPNVLYPPHPQPSPFMLMKNEQKRQLKKTSNGLGFMVLTYFLVMNAAVMGIILFSTFTGNRFTDNNTAMYCLEIFCAVLSSLAAGIFYMLLSRQKPSRTLTKSIVKPTLLIPILFIGMAIAMVANLAATMVDQNFEIFGIENSAGMSSDAKSPVEMILYIVSTAIVPALAEEFAFRGVMMSILRKYGDAFAIITSAVMFGAMHGNTTQIAFAFILGLVFAFVDCKTNSIVPSIIIHFMNNFYAVVMDILQSNGSISTQLFNVIQVSVVLAFCVIGILSFIFLNSGYKNFFRTSDFNAELNPNSDILSFKEKLSGFFFTPGVLISLSLFAAEMVYYLFPDLT